MVPGPMVAELNEAGMFAQEGLRNVLAVWRNPERLATCPPWRHASAHLVDVQVFGEIGLIAARREASGMPATICRLVRSRRRAAPMAIVSADVARTAAGTLALRGPMVPRASLPAGGCAE